MRCYTEKLAGLIVRCALFGLIGGTLFAVISGQGPSPVPYLAAMGAGAGWQFTRPFGVYAPGEKGLILGAVLLTVRIGLALVIGWVILIPYALFLTVRAVRS